MSGQDDLLSPGPVGAASRPVMSVGAGPAPESSPAPRVHEPMAIQWQGVEHRVESWDVHGFALTAPIPRLLGPGRGRVADFTVLIGTGRTRIEMQVQARSSDPSESLPTRYQFVDLDRAQAEVLHRIVDHAIGKQAMSLTMLLNETTETRTARAETGARVIAARRWFQLGLAGIVVTLAGLATWSSMTTVTARYAAVTAAGTAVSVPAAGILSQVAVAAGQPVREGDLLGYLLPSDLDRQLQALADRRRTLEADQAELDARRRALVDGGAVLHEGRGADRRRAEQAVELAGQRLSVERATLAALRAGGLPTAERQRQRARQEAVVIEAQAALLAARTRLEAVDQAEALAGTGTAPDGLHGGATPLEAIELRLAHLGSEIALAYQREDELAQGIPVLSPCDCVVETLARRSGEWADPSQPWAILAADGPTTIHALVMAETARAIRIGDGARITLADGTALRGSVARVSYSAHWPGHVGLQENVFAADRYARVEVIPATSLSAPVGMTARVGIDTDRWLGALRSRAGI